MEEYLAWNENTETWRCLICQKEFRNKYSSIRHFKIIHCANERLQCHLCLMWFKNKVCLDQHIRNLHKKGLVKQNNVDYQMY